MMKQRRRRDTSRDLAANQPIRPNRRSQYLRRVLIRYRAALAGDGAPIGDPALDGIVLTAWACLLGYLVAEIFGSLTALITSAGLLYQAHVHTVMAGMGFQPALA
jgi:hypothetical protein